MIPYASRFIFVSSFILLTLLILSGCDSSDSPSRMGTGMPVTVSGQLHYQDREVDDEGFTGEKPFKPIRLAEVEVVRNADSQVLAVGASDANGAYRVTFTNLAAAGVYVRVLSRTAPAMMAEIEVWHATLRSLFGVRSAVVDDSSGATLTLDLDVPLLDDNGDVIGGPFNILDVLIDGVAFVQQASGVIPELATVFWEPGGGVGTFFDRQRRTIHLLGGAQGDSDEYDDVIILHEYGHFIAAQFSLDHSPGGVHILTDRTQDMRLSWSEGWAHFFSSAVRGDPSHIDTIGGDPPNNGATFFNLEGPAPNTDSAPIIYSTNEIAVAAVLWDIFDAPNESFDTLAVGIPPIWDVLSQYLCNTTHLTTCPNTVEAISLEDFWDGWFSRQHNVQAAMEMIIEDREIEFFPDRFEPNDTIADATLVTPDGAISMHTLFGSTDIDVMAFQAARDAAYRVETIALGNGADPFLEIIDRDGITVLATHDDDPTVLKTSDCGPLFFGVNTCPPNDVSTLAARLTFTAPSDGRFFARISRAPTAPPSAGAYGSYQFRITRQ